MRIGVKHSNQQSLVFSDFSGGLNTEATIEGIGENQLSMVENMEVDHSTGRLKTICGTKTYLKREKLFALMYDSTNKKMLVVTETKKVYVDNQEIGEITGKLYPIVTTWDKGILIASGGRLQYYDGNILQTLDKSPTNSSSVYIRAGRVIVSNGNELRYSGIGDANDWETDSNDESRSKFLEAGYKDGGQFLTMVNLSQYILIVKDNRRLYRLSGEYPSWELNEVSRNVDCRDRLSVCAVADAVFILGMNGLQGLGESEFSGDLKPAEVSMLIKKQIRELSKETKVRFIATYNQIWLIDGSESILVYDLVFKSWFKRKYNDKVKDVVEIEEEIYLLRPDEVSKEDGTIFVDKKEPLEWKFRGRRLVSQHEFLLKKTTVAFIPMNANIYSGEIRVGAVKVVFPIPLRQLRLYQNKSNIWKNRTKISGIGRGKGVYFSELKTYENQGMIHGNMNKIFSRRTIMKENRNVFRAKYLDILGFGKYGGVIIQEVRIEIAEV